MNIIISGRHVNVTESMKEHARKKAEKLLKHFEGIINIHVTLKIEDRRHIAEFVVSAPRGNTLTADFTSTDMYTAVDGVVDKIERQLTKYKEKLKDKRQRRKTSEQGELAALTSETEHEAENGEPEESAEE